MSTPQEEFEGVEDAWREFRLALADRISEQEDNDHILWELDVPERFESPTGPYIQVWWHDREQPVAEVSSNRVLDDKFRLGKAQRRRLREMGWQRPGKERQNYWLPVDPAYVDQVADLLVRALREVFDVVHPAFLVDRFREGFEVPDWEDDEIEQQLPIAQFPESHDELEELVDIALGPDAGEPVPIRDDDGDRPYRSETAMVFVRVLPDVPVVRLFSELVVEIEDREAAAFEVSVLNRGFDFKFVLRDTRIVMSVDVPAWPFAPEHLRLTLGRMCELAPTIDGDLARRVSGRRFFEPSRGDAT